MSEVYFTKKIDKDSIVDIYEKLGKNLEGKIAIKVHSGEKGNQNFIRPEMYEKIVSKLNGTIVECNTAYEGERSDTKKHTQLMKEHGWSDLYEVDIMDGEEEVELPIEDGKQIKINYVGKNLLNYDSMLVISHFKGHPMGGFGGALKNISIGIASAHGKAYIHGAGDEEKIWTADHDSFLESMADASKSIVEHFKDNILFINVMCNMSVDCDCCSVAEDPCIEDIGILASKDPVALDQACLDLIYNSNDKGKDHFIERIESRNGIHTIEAAELLNVGSRKYKLIEF